MQNIIHVKLKCVICLEPTEFINPRNGLPFCCDRHSEFYRTRKLVDGGGGSRNNDSVTDYGIDSEKRLNDMKIMFQSLVDNYIHVENQDALWDGKVYLNKLIEVIEFEIITVQKKITGYNTYKTELESALLRSDVYEKALEKILSAIRVMYSSLVSIYNSLVDLELNAVKEKKLIDRVM